MHRIAIACALAAGWAGSANAMLVYEGQADLQGTGLGSVSTVLSMQGKGNSGTETASVGLSSNGLTDVVSGDAKTGASQTQTVALDSLGLTSASDLRIVFNPSEPGSNSSITLQDLQLNIYSATGAVLFNSGAFNALSFEQTQSGTGSAGLVFRLDEAHAALAQAAAFGANAQGSRIGLTATASNAQGGVESFYVAAAPVPEPESYAMLAGGLLMVGLAVRRRRALR